MKPAARSEWPASACISPLSVASIESHRERSPDSFSSSDCAEPSTPSALARLALSVSASAVRLANCSFICATFWSSITSASWHLTSRSLDDSSSADSSALA
eukprot:515138-Pleurochrysis_carterae.AAC.2